MSQKRSDGFEDAFEDVWLFESTDDFILPEEDIDILLDAMTGGTRPEKFDAPHVISAKNVSLEPKRRMLGRYLIDHEVVTCPDGYPESQYALVVRIQGFDNKKAITFIAIPAMNWLAENSMTPDWEEEISGTCLTYKNDEDHPTLRPVQEELHVTQSASQHSFRCFVTLKWCSFAFTYNHQQDDISYFKMMRYQDDIAENTSNFLPKSDILGTNNKVARKTAPEVLSKDKGLEGKLEEIAARFGLSTDQFLRVAGGDDPTRDIAVHEREEEKLAVGLKIEADLYDRILSVVNKPRLVSPWIIEAVENQLDLDSISEIEVPPSKRGKPSQGAETITVGPSFKHSTLEKLGQIAQEQKRPRTAVIYHLARLEIDRIESLDQSPGQEP